MSASDYDKRIFSDNLKRLMKRNDITPSQICASLGVAKSTVSSWMNGVKIPRMDKVVRLSKMFGVQNSALIEPYEETAEEELDRQILALFAKLNPENAKSVLSHAAFLLHEQEQNKE